MEVQKLIFKYPPGKPIFIGVLYKDNASAVIPTHLLNELPASFNLTLYPKRYPYMTLSREPNRPLDHGSRTNYRHVTYEVQEANEFADLANSSKINLGHVIMDANGNLQIARTDDGRPFVIPLKSFIIYSSLLWQAA